MDWDPNAPPDDGYICPPCPIFRPSAKEFSNPLQFISSIRHIGEKSGIVKIVPPAGWRPPFAINEKSFKFRTRLQQLNCLEGLARAESQFVESLRLFLYRNKTPMQDLPRVDDHPLNLHALYKTVIQMGGYASVCDKNQWGQVAASVETLSPFSTRTRDSMEELGEEYERHYKTCLLPYERQDKSISDIKDEDVEKTPASSTTVKSSGSTSTPVIKTRTDSSHSITSELGDSVQRTLFQPSEELPLDPESLQPDPKRRYRLSHPAIRVGQQFYQFSPERGAVLAKVTRVFGGKKPHAWVQYASSGSKTDMKMGTLEILVANGWNHEAAELAYKSEICQACLRGDCSDKMLLCDSCNGGFHLFCLDEKLEVVPTGDWYCSDCVQDDAEHKDEFEPTFGFEIGAEQSVNTFRQKADAWKRDYFNHLSDEQIQHLSIQELEQEYWKVLATPLHEQKLEVEYGSDIDSGANGSGFPRKDLLGRATRAVNRRQKQLMGQTKAGYAQDDVFCHGLETNESAEQVVTRYASSDWNLNNLPKLEGSMLQHLNEDIKGVMVPWVYMGMCFSTFCWHVEDHNFYSISYVHCGAPKVWYGVPCAEAERFEAVMKKIAPELFGAQPDLHMQLVTMFSPHILRQHGVPVYRATHNPNEFIVTFPSAYHGGFNAGFNCAEAVNFATMDWLPVGAKSLEKYKAFRKLPVFSHDALLLSLAQAVGQKHTFDGEMVQKYLVPALETLVHDYKTFEAYVDKMEVRKASMKTFANGTFSLGADASTSRRSAVRRGTSGKKPSARPSRMEVWAGRSGKTSGLRCVRCKQYCYLQAVVCTKCRHHSSVGCMDHFVDMCNCDMDEHYVYLYRYDGSFLEKLVAGVEQRLRKIQEWETEFHTLMETASTSKVDAQDVKHLYHKGMEAGGVVQSKLDRLSELLQSADRWSEDVKVLLRRCHAYGTRSAHRSPPVKSEELMKILEDKKKLSVHPSPSDELDTLVHQLQTHKRTAEDLVASISSIVHTDTGQDLTQMEDLIRDVVHLDKDMTQMNVSLPSCLQDSLKHGKTVLEVLLSARSLLSSIESSLNVSEQECLDVLSKAHELQTSDTQKLSAVKELETLLERTRKQAEGVYTTSDTCKSTEELEMLQDTLDSLPIRVQEADKVARVLRKRREWEERAEELLQATGRTKPSLDQAESFYHDADACYVQSSSLLKRQLGARLEDCRRWTQELSSLFLRSEGSVQEFFRDVTHKFHTFPRRSIDPVHRLQCICEQLPSSRVPMGRCSRCSLLFHPQCVEQQMFHRSGSRVVQSTPGVCFRCQPPPSRLPVVRMKGHETTPSLFCLCRGEERAPMVCCDCCDEWYHASCIGMNGADMDHLDVYRCARCVIRQNLYYMDKREVRQECLGKQPSVSKVERLMSKLESSLVAVPVGGVELVRYMDKVKQVEECVKEYVREFTSYIVPAAFSRIDCHAEEARLMELMLQVTDLEVSLDGAMGSLAALHWCLRACRLVFDTKSLPRYTHLVLLLQDTHQPNFSFPRRDYDDVRQTIEGHVEKARAWLEQVNALPRDNSHQMQEVEALWREYQDLSRFFILPDFETNVLANMMQQYSEQGSKRRRVM